MDSMLYWLLWTDTPWESLAVVTAIFWGGVTLLSVACLALLSRTEQTGLDDRRAPGEPNVRLAAVTQPAPAARRVAVAMPARGEAAPHAPACAKQETWMRAGMARYITVGGRLMDLNDLQPLPFVVAPVWGPELN